MISQPGGADNPLKFKLINVFFLMSYLHLHLHLPTHASLSPPKFCLHLKTFDLPILVRVRRVMGLLLLSSVSSQQHFIQCQQLIKIFLTKSTYFYFKKITSTTHTFKGSLKYDLKKERKRDILNS